MNIRLVVRQPAQLPQIHQLSCLGFVWSGFVIPLVHL